MAEMDSLDLYLKETQYLNFTDHAVQEFLAPIDCTRTLREQAIQLYYLVRDGFLYDPYHLDLRPQALSCSHILGKNRAWCVEKAIVMATGARALGIPSKVGYAVVTNHLGDDKLETYLKRKEIVFHGYVSLYLEGKWVICTPAFDSRVCRINRVAPLEWDGQTDSLFQAFRGEEQFMEYIHYYGDFADVPVELMNAEMKAYYPHLFEEVYDTKAFSFHHI